MAGGGGGPLAQGSQTLLEIRCTALTKLAVLGRGWGGTSLGWGSEFVEECSRRQPPPSSPGSSRKFRSHSQWRRTPADHTPMGGGGRRGGWPPRCLASSVSCDCFFKTRLRGKQKQRRLNFPALPNVSDENTGKFVTHSMKARETRWPDGGGKVLTTGAERAPGCVARGQPLASRRRPPARL